MAVLERLLAILLIGYLIDMKLTEDEKRRVIDELEDVEPARRNTLLANLQNFSSWLMNACYDIFIKVKNFIVDIWDWFKTHIF